MFHYLSYKQHSAKNLYYLTRSLQFLCIYAYVIYSKNNKVSREVLRKNGSLGLTEYTLTFMLNKILMYLLPTTYIIDFWNSISMTAVFQCFGNKVVRIKFYIWEMLSSFTIEKNTTKTIMGKYFTIWSLFVKLSTAKFVYDFLFLSGRATRFFRWSL